MGHFDLSFDHTGALTCRCAHAFCTAECPSAGAHEAHVTQCCLSLPITLARGLSRILAPVLCGRVTRHSTRERVALRLAAPPTCVFGARVLFQHASDTQFDVSAYLRHTRHE